MANLIPSASNSIGTGGGIVAAVAVGLLAKAGYLAAAAAFIGLPEATLTTMAVAGIGLIVNYAVTHWAEAKNLNDLLSAYWPQIQASYPGKDGKTPPSSGPPNSNINKP